MKLKKNSKNVTKGRVCRRHGSGRDSLQTAGPNRPGPRQLGDLSVIWWWAAAAVVRQTVQFATVCIWTNVPQNESSIWAGAKVHWNFHSWEREFQGARVLYVRFCFLEISFPRAKVQRNEKSFASCVSAP